MLFNTVLLQCRPHCISHVYSGIFTHEFPKINKCLLWIEWSVASKDQRLWYSPSLPLWCNAQWLPWMWFHWVMSMHPEIWRSSQAVPNMTFNNVTIEKQDGTDCKLCPNVFFNNQTHCHNPTAYTLSARDL
jgi:hypothetical protein